VKRLPHLLSLPVLAIALTGLQATSANAATTTLTAAPAVSYAGVPGHAGLPETKAAAASFVTNAIYNAWDKLCLQPEDESIEVPVLQEPCQESGFDEWVLEDVQPAGYGEIVNQGNNECLAVAGYSTSNGALIYDWPCNGTASQQWGPVAGSCGAVGYSCRYQNSDGLELSVDGCNDDPGDYINQWGYVPLPGGYCQLWNWYY
jgi:hypothetical protein